MQNLLPIVRKLSAFADNPPVYTWLDPGNDVSWLVRPLFIQDHLRVMHSWLNKVNSFTNQAFDRSKQQLIKHYRERLRSETEQSFCIQRKKHVVAQFDLVPAVGSPLALFHPVDEDGFALYYIFPGDRLHEYCQCSLELFMRLVFSRYPYYSVFLEIPLDQRAIQRIASGLGFNQVKEYWHQQKQVGLYRATLSTAIQSSNS